MPRDATINKVMVIGSGPIVIGQAAEFDYSGSQACRALKEEGVEVVLVNSNPATIMTDTNMADRVYLEPLTAGCNPHTGKGKTGRAFTHTRGTDRVKPGQGDSPPGNSGSPRYQASGHTSGYNRKSGGPGEI